jgi:hypothetical protein
VGIYMERFKLTLPLFYMDPKTEGSLGIERVPFTVLLDREGRVDQVYSGYSREGMLDLRQRAEDLLARPGGQGGK